MSEELRSQLRKAHGDTIGDLAYKAEIEKREREATRVQKLRDDIAEAQAAVNAKSAQLAQRLVPFDQRMQTTYDAWLSACNEREAQRVRNSAELSPLENRIRELTVALNESPYQDRVQQWSTPEWHKATTRLPEVPPLREGRQSRKP